MSPQHFISYKTISQLLYTRHRFSYKLGVPSALNMLKHLRYHFSMLLISIKIKVSLCTITPQILTVRSVEVFGKRQGLTK